MVGPARRHPPEGLGKLEALLVHRLAVEPLVGRLAVFAHHVLGQDIPRELHKPSEDGVRTTNVP
eukprot:6967194-Lingulodinium_polyedra.AAC.1